MYLASALRRAGHAVALVDYLVPAQEHKATPPPSFAGTHNPPYVHFGWPTETCLAHIAQLEFDAVGLYSGQCAVWEAAAELCRGLRSSGVPVVVGGPFATTAADEVHDKFGDPSVVVAGEGELVAEEAFARAADGEQGITLQGMPLSDLDEFGPPDYNLPDYTAYPKYGGRVRGVLTASRGCPWACRFCSVHTIMGRRYRHVSIGRLEADLRALAELGVRYFCFLDDNLFLDATFGDAVLELLTRLRSDPSFKRPIFHVEEGVEIRTAAQPGFIRRFAAAGFDTLPLGLETLDPAALAANKKPYGAEELAAVVAEATAVGIRPLAFYILGFPQDTFGSCIRAFRELAGYGVDVRANNLKLYPGTETTANYIAQEIIAPGFDWRLSSYYTLRAGALSYPDIKLLKGYLRAATLLPCSIFDAPLTDVVAACSPHKLTIDGQVPTLYGKFFRPGPWRRLLEILAIRLGAMGAVVETGEGYLRAATQPQPVGPVQEALATVYNRWQPTIKRSFF